MASEQDIEILKNERACVQRAESGCDRRCEICDLVRPSEDIIEAYNNVINFLEQSITKIKGDVDHDEKLRKDYQ